MDRYSSDKMHCFVPFCENSSGCAGITFHKFPRSKYFHAAWLKALAKPESCFPHWAVICSQHFTLQDFIVTKSGLKKLKPEAVPHVMYELELSEEKPFIEKPAEIEEETSDSVVKIETTELLLSSNAQIKLEPLEPNSGENCCNVYDSQFEVIKHEVCDNGSGPEYANQQLAARRFCMNSAHTNVTSAPVALSTNTFFIKQEATEQAGTYGNNIRQHELPSSKSPCIEHLAHTTDDKLCSNIDSNARKITITDNIVHTYSGNHVEVKRFICDMCLHVFTNKQVLKNHISSRHQTKSFTCKICQYQCKHNSGMIRHMRYHSGEKPFVCNLCPFKSSENNKLVRHMRIHTGEKPFGCALCEYKAAEKSKLKNHMRKHTGEKFACEFCDYKSTHRSNLDVHMRKHTGLKPFACDLCQYRSSEKAKLLNHIRTHTGEKPFACLQCQYKCNRKSSLYIHMRRHTGVQTNVCEICQYKCARNSDLIRHVRTHSGEKPFACKFCQYRCSVNGALLRHMRTHTGEKRFGCDLCEYKCTDKRYLVKHIGTHSKKAGPIVGPSIMDSTHSSIAVEHSSLMLPS